MSLHKITSEKTGSNSTTKLPSRENAVQLNNRFNVLAVDDSADEAELIVLSQGITSPFASLPSTNLLSTPYSIIHVGTNKLPTDTAKTSSTKIRKLAIVNITLPLKSY